MLDFSVITVCYNACRTVKETVDSVLAQKGVSFEYLIIDGGSNDSTVEIISDFHDLRINITSEPDNGLYDAMNKGISKAKGKYIAIINSDDVYADDSVLERVKDKFEQKKADIVYGDLVFFSDRDGLVKRRWKSVIVDTKKEFEAYWRSGWQCPHPSTFVKRDIYQEIGSFDIGYKISADYDFLVRAAVKYNKKFAYIDNVLVRMRLGGESTRGIKSIIDGNREVISAWRGMELKPYKFLVLRKLLYKIYYHLV